MGWMLFCLFFFLLFFLFVLFCLHSQVSWSITFSLTMCRLKITTQVKSPSFFSLLVASTEVSILWCILQWYNCYPFTCGEGRQQNMPFSECYSQDFARASLWPRLCLHLGRMHSWVWEPIKESHCDMISRSPPLRSQNIQLWINYSLTKLSSGLYITAATMGSQWY